MTAGDYTNCQSTDNITHLLDDEVVVATAQTTVASQHNQQHSLHRAHLAQRAVHVLNAQALVHTVQHLTAAW
jgi:hypothetical protein